MTNDNIATGADERKAPTIENLTLFDDFTRRPAGAAMGYRREPAFGEPMHTWWIKGVGGGIHIWARLSKLTGWPTEWIGGVEVHFAKCPDDSGWFDPAAPSQGNCWLLEGPCWHDGSSLYFSERIAPMMPWPDGSDPHHFDSLPHSYIGFELADWFRDKLTQDQPA